MVMLVYRRKIYVSAWELLLIVIIVLIVREALAYDAIRYQMPPVIELKMFVPEGSVVPPERENSNIIGYPGEGSV